MLLKKILGILILILNIAGIGYLIYVGIIFVWKEYFSGLRGRASSRPNPVKKKKPDIINDDIVLDDDDLLKDMDLSDLDDLDFDDLDLNDDKFD